MMITSDEYLEQRDYCTITGDECEQVFPRCTKCNIAIQRVIDDDSEMKRHRTSFTRTLNGVEVNPANTVARARTIEDVLKSLPKTYEPQTPFRDCRWLEPTMIINNWPALCYIQKEYHQYTPPLYYCYSHPKTVLIAVYSDVVYLAAPSYDRED